MKKVLVTGATGFIGNYVIEELLRAGCTVVATSSSEEKARSYSWFPHVEYRALDFKNLSATTDYAAYFNNPEAVIHLAWEGLPNYKALFHFEENLPRHYAFIKNLVAHGVLDITITGTCFEYGFQEGCLQEEMPAEPTNAYALAKDVLRRFLQELQKGTPFSLKWIRLFYMFGKGQNPSSIFSKLEKAIQDGDETFNMSGGEQIRDYLPVEEIAASIKAIAMQNSLNGIINCCSGKGVKLKDLVEDYLRQRSSALRLNLGYYPYPDYEPMAFWGDNTKLQTILRNERSDH